MEGGVTSLRAGKVIFVLKGRDNFCDYILYNVAPNISGVRGPYT